MVAARSTRGAAHSLRSPPRWCFQHRPPPVFRLAGARNIEGRASAPAPPSQHQHVRWGGAAFGPWLLGRFAPVRPVGRPLVAAASLRSSARLPPVGPRPCFPPPVRRQFRRRTALQSLSYFHHLCGPRRRLRPGGRPLVCRSAPLTGPENGRAGATRAASFS